MAGYTFFQYLKIRLQVAVVRLLLNLVTTFTKRRVTNDPSVAFGVLKVPSRDAGRRITVHVYKPKELDVSASGPTAVLINMHGRVVFSKYFSTVVVRQFSARLRNGMTECLRPPHVCKVSVERC